MVEQALVATVNLRLLIETQNLTVLSLAVYMSGWLFFVVVGLIRSSHPTLSSFFALVAFDYLAVHNQLLASLTAWLVQVVVVVAALLPDILLKFVYRTFFPQPVHVVRELELGFGAGLIAHSTAAALANPDDSPSLAASSRKDF